MILYIDYHKFIFRILWVLGIPLFDVPKELGSRPRLTLIVLLADLSLIATSPDVLLKLFTAATSKEQYAPSKLKLTDKGFEPNGWKEAMACVERDKWLIAAHKELARHNKNGTWKIIPRIKAKVLKRYLAINVIYGDHREIYLSQADYINQILTRFGLNNCNSVATPMDKRTQLTASQHTTTKHEIKEF
ncbi:hypothetical protein N7530_003768 [Penicillium desertorum]|uniref:Reverse transcriptase Ty1/copia-type domain-containing protein n=1 Tax=Penicillium desertorum TaxID=1303715 RepID=A0A9W9WX28_9EURO|nr:hypothetical protein N7530_003768 [Penicillium desertorum]